MVIDRGNVVEFYNNGEKLATLDREAESPTGNIEFGYGFTGDFEIAIIDGHAEDVAVAIICELLNDYNAAAPKAKLFIENMFT